MISLLLPAVGTAAGIGMMAAFAGSSPGIMFASIPMMLATYVAGYYTYSTQKRKARTAETQRVARYSGILAGVRKKLEEARSEQVSILLEANPDPAECIERARQLDRHLWERSPQDADFAEVRLGLGRLPLAVAIKAPDESATQEPDALSDSVIELVNRFSKVPDLPVSLSLGQTGVVGIVGGRRDVLNTCRALTLQLAAHHSPDDVKIGASFPDDEQAEWTWMRWLPHAWSEDRRQRLLAKEKEATHRLFVALDDRLARRRLAPPAAVGQNLHLPLIVVFLADARQVEGERLLSTLLEQGPTLGTCSILLADRKENLPKHCRAIIECGSPLSSLVTTGAGSAETEFRADAVTCDMAEQLARTMAPIRLQKMQSPTDLPKTLPLFDLLSCTDVNSLDVAGQWKKSEPFRSLAVPLGMRSGGEALSLDLHERGHGPHGLVAGATGSGKSELLQTLILGAALHYDPKEVAFVLVDYKGGGMANALMPLPHVIGTITNLEGNLALRALLALRGELRRRERLLASVGTNHIDEYQKKVRRGEASEPLPRLIVVVDEFAELKLEHPDFIRDLISTVRLGRSLGVHLILATQKPSGVVDEQIWANSRFRLCLRVERPEDSREVLKRPDAAGLTGAGRAFFQVGNNELFEMFQVAWSGAPCLPACSGGAGVREIAEILLDGSRRGFSSPPATQAAGKPPTQLEALVEHIAEVSQREQIARLPGPWLSPLSPAIVLGDICPAEGWDGALWRPAQEWLAPIVGLVDDPGNQRQDPLRVHLGREGHLLAYGAPGSGKTTLIQTLVTSLALSHSPADVRLYLLDFAGRSLSVFESLPHVGAVILSDETDRLKRLFRFLSRELEDRKTAFAQAGVTTLPAYRHATGEPVPAMVLVIDNYAGFAAAYEEVEGRLAELAQEGANLGLHFVVTATHPSAVRSRTASNISLALCLQLADKGEYSVAVGRTQGLEPAAIPGRGLIKGAPPLEFQTAMPTSGTTEVARTTALRALIADMAKAWTGSDARLPELPKVVSLEHTQRAGTAAASDSPTAVALGLETQDLQPVVVDLDEGPHFLIVGPPLSGKTTLMQSWILALAWKQPATSLQVYLADFREAGSYALSRLPHVRKYMDDELAVREALEAINAELEERRQLLVKARTAAGHPLQIGAALADRPPILFCIDDLQSFSMAISSPVQELLEQALRNGRSLRFHLVLAAASSHARAAWAQWVRAVAEGQAGFVLGATDPEDVGLLGVRLPYADANKQLPPGEGLYARRGKWLPLKAATWQADSANLDELVQRAQEQVGPRDGGADGTGKDRCSP